MPLIEAYKWDKTMPLEHILSELCDGLDDLALFAAKAEEPITQQHARYVRALEAAQRCRRMLAALQVA